MIGILKIIGGGILKGLGFLVSLGKSYLKFSKNLIKRGIKKLINIFTTRFGVPFSIILGVAFIVGSIYISMQPIIDNIFGRMTIFRFAPNFICWFGGIIGTILIMIPIMKWYYSVQNTLQNFQAEIKNLKNDLADNNAKRGILDFKYTFQFGVLEIGTPINISRNEILANTYKKGGVFRNSDVQTRDEYKSIIIGTKKIKLGLDFSNILVAEKSNNVLVSGVKCMCLGVTDLDMEWQTAEIRRSNIRDNKIEKTEVIRDHPDIKEQMEKDVEKLQKHINEYFSPDSSVVSRIEAAGQNYIKQFLAPHIRNKEIKFIKTDIEAGLKSVKLFDFADKI